MIGSIEIVVSIWMFVHSVGSVSTRNSSNILRLSKLQSTPSIAAETTLDNFADKLIEIKGENELIERKALIGFAKDGNRKRYPTVIGDYIANPDSELDFMTEKLKRSGNIIDWLSDLYDPSRWNKIPGKPSEDCRYDMNIFLRSLKNGTLWAAKMSDASGRYSSQFFFGNEFWLGSSMMCTELAKNDGPGSPSVSEDRPPFGLRFHVAKMDLTLPSDVSNLPHQIFLGLCLPSSCDNVSLKSMLRASADRIEKQGNFTHGSSGPKISIARVKSVPSSDYTLWFDAKLHILLAVSGILLVLMTLAIIYDYKDSIAETDVEKSNSGNNNEKNGSYPDKNCSQDRKVSGIQDNSKELIEKNEREIKASGNERKEVAIDGRGLWIKYLLAFHPVRNGSKIISTEPAPRDSLTCLHGLRVISLGWVVMVHTYMQVFAIAENKTLRTVTERNFMFQTISNATFSVDTFFFISGLLVTILYYRSLDGIKTAEKNFVRSSAKKFAVMILYRFIRLTPSYLFALGLNEIAVRQAIARTVFMPAVMDHLTCEKYWWRNALYLNSLYSRAEMCMLWSWYMANDTQFYVLGIFLLLLSVKYFKMAAVSVILLIVSAWLTTFTVAYQNDYVARIQEPFALFDELYDKPWLRAGPYLIGVITGYILFKTNCNIQTPMFVKIVGWLLSASAMLSVVYGLYPGEISVISSSVYASMGHTAWAIAVAFIVVQCCTGSAPIVNSVLSLRLIYPLSRLTYCAYLVHPIVMLITTSQMDGPLHLHNGIVLILYFGNLVASYLLSFCISLALESPVVNLLKIALVTKKRTR